MTFDAHPIKMNRIKDINSLEIRKLDRKIKGHAGLEMQKKVKVQQAQQECDLLRRELAEMYFADCRRKQFNKKQTEGKLPKTFTELDTALLLMDERENTRRIKNRKLLFRAKQKDKLMEEMVKEFVTKLESETTSDTPGSSSQEQSENIANSREEEHTQNKTVGNERQKRFSCFRSSSRAWNEAKNTRYVRTKVLRDFEIELTVNEVFSGCMR